MRLLPTATSADANGSGGSSESNVTLTDAVVRTELGTTDNIRLMPSPTASEANGIGEHGTGGQDLRTTVALLPTPSAADGNGGGRGNSPGHQDTLPGTARELPESSWGPYAAAICRWERALGRPAPEPTDLGPKGGRRLSAAFVEWMMGLPAGWVTDLGLSRVQQLKMLGNGVVTQQAVAALRSMLPTTRMTPERLAHITLWRCPDCPVLIPSMAGRLSSVDVHEKQHAAERRYNEGDTRWAKQRRVLSRRD